MSEQKENVFTGEHVRILECLVDKYIATNHLNKEEPQGTRRRLLMQEIQRALLFSDKIVIYSKE